MSQTLRHLPLTEYRHSRVDRRKMPCICKPCIYRESTTFTQPSSHRPTKRPIHFQPAKKP